MGCSEHPRAVRGVRRPRGRRSLRRGRRPHHESGHDGARTLRRRDHQGTRVEEAAAIAAADKAPELEGGGSSNENTLVQELAALAPEAEQGKGVTIEYGVLRGMTSTAVSGQVAAFQKGAEAIKEFKEYGAGAPAKQQEAGRALDATVTKAELAAAVQKKSPAVPANVAGQVEKTISTVTHTASITIKEFELGFKIAVAGIDPALIVTFLTQAPEIIQALLTSLGIETGPTETQQILQNTKQIEEMIEKLSEQIAGGFAAVDVKLTALSTQLLEVTQLLQNIGSNVGRISDEVAQIKDSLDQMEATLFEIASTQRAENFQTALNTDIGYSTRTPGGVGLPLYDFEEGAGLFYTWGATYPFNAISELPRSQWSAEPDALANILATSTSGEPGDNNALNFNLDFLAWYADKEHWEPSVGGQPQKLRETLPNPEVWASGASALDQLLVESPEYATHPLVEEISHEKGIGTELSSALNQLSVGADAAAPLHAGPDATEIDTGSSVLNGALGNYLERATEKAPSAPFTGAGLLNRIRAEENYYLSEQNKGIPVECSPCGLAKKPGSGEDAGEPYINVWGADPEQTPNTTNLPKFQSTSQTASKAGVGGTAPAAPIPGEANECYKAETINLAANPTLDDPFTNVLANAWHLGLGQLETCFEEGGGEAIHEAQETNNPDEPALFDLEEVNVKLIWRWRPAGQAPEQLGSIAFTGKVFNEYKCLTGDNAKLLSEYWTTNSKVAQKTGTPACQQYDFGKELEKVASEMSQKLTTEQTSGSAACTIRFMSTCTFEYEPAIAPREAKAVKNQLLALGGKMLEELAPLENGNRLTNNSDGAQPEQAEQRANGGRTLVDDYIQLALPTELAKDPQLRSLVFGTSHLPDNSPTDYEIFAEIRHLLGTLEERANDNNDEDPTAKGGAIEQKIVGSVGALAQRLKEDMTTMRQSGSKGDSDPLVTGTLARLGISEAMLAPLTAVGRPVNTAAPEVLGSPRVGQTLTCSPGEWQAQPALTPSSFSYQWLIDGKLPTTGTDTAKTYTVGTSDVGHSLSCRVVAVNSEGEGTATSKSVLVAATPELDLELTQDGPGSSLATAEPVFAGPAQTVNYTLVVRNSGNVKVALANLTASLCTAPSLAASTELAPAAALTYYCQYTVPSFGLYGNQMSIEGIPTEGGGFPITRSSNIALIEPPTPTVVTLPATAVGQTGANLNASVNANGGSASCKLEYGTTMAYGTTVGCKPAVILGSRSVTDAVTLLPNTTYHYRVASYNSLPDFKTATRYGKDEKFTTLSVQAPTVGLLEFENVTQTSATATFTLNPNGEAIKECRIVYYPNSSPSNTKEAQCATNFGSGTQPVTAKVPLTGLQANTQYGVALYTAGSLPDDQLTEFTTPAWQLATVQIQAPTKPGATSATLSGTVNPNGSLVKRCEFVYSGGSMAGSVPCSVLPGSGTKAVAVTGQLTGLTTETPYTVKLVAENTAGDASQGVMFTTAPPPYPTLDLEAASGVTQGTATLNATVNPNGNKVTGCSFEYGVESYTSTAPCKPLPGAGTTPVAVTAALTKLDPASHYWVRIEAVVQGGGGAVTDVNVPFTTGAAQAPTITAVTASKVEATSALLKSTVNPNNEPVTTCTFDYGQTAISEHQASCAKLPGEGASPVAVSAQLAGLEPATTYKAEINAIGKGGIAVSPTFLTFKTGAAPGPAVVTGAAEEVGATGAKLDGTVNPKGSEVPSGSCSFVVTVGASEVEAPCEPAGSITGTAAKAVSAHLAGLVPGTAYRDRLSATSAQGTGTGATAAFTTEPLAHLTGAGETGAGGFGGSVAISGDGSTALVGAAANDRDEEGFGVGAAWAYTRSGATWSQQGPILSGGSEHGGFGVSVALSANGQEALVGAPFDGPNNSGAVYAFARSGSSWTPLGGPILDGEQLEGSYFGISVALSEDGSTAVVGGLGANGGEGAAWIFTRSGSTWTQQARLPTPSGESGRLELGYSAAISADGNTVVVGGAGASSAWVYTRTGTTWTQQGPTLPGGNSPFRDSVAMSGDGNTVLVGAPYEGFRELYGAAYVFTRSGSTWTETARLKLAESHEYDMFGFSVALSYNGTGALIGVPGEEGSTGSAWQFTLSNGTWRQAGKISGTGESGEGQFGAAVALSKEGTHGIVGGLADNSDLGAAWPF